MSLSWRLRCGPGLVDEDEQVAAVDADVAAAAMRAPGSERQRGATRVARAASLYRAPLSLGAGA